MAKEPTFTMPPNLELEDQLGFAIGNLVAQWSNCESLLYGFLACVIQGEHGQPQIVWLNIKNSSARADLVARLVEASPLSQSLAKQVHKHVADFKSISKTRNFFCPAHYSVDVKTQALVGVQSYELVMTGAFIHRFIAHLTKE